MSTNEADASKELSDVLKLSLKDTVMKLYKMELEDPKESLNIILKDAVEELGDDNVVVMKLAKKLMADLKRYESYEAAKWLLTQHVNRATNDRFGVLVLSQRLNADDENSENGNDTNNEILKIAIDEDDPVKLLLAKAYLAGWHFKRKDTEKFKALLENINDRPEDIKNAIESAMMSEKRSLYLIYAYLELTFMFRNNDENNKTIEYLRKALKVDICNRDLGLSLHLYTNLFRYLQFTEHQQDECDLNLFFENLNKAITDEFPLMNGINVLTEAYLTLVLAARKIKTFGMQRVTATGKEIFELLKKMFDEHHHEVVFFASQLSLDYQIQGIEERAEYFLQVALLNIYKIRENSEVLLKTKLRSYRNISQLMYRLNRFQEAEKYCRENLRLNIKRYGETHQYVAASMRNLSRILRRGSESSRAEGLQLLKNCLKMSQDCSPGFRGFHDKVAREIQNYYLPLRLGEIY